MQISREEREEAQPIRLPGTCLLTRISMLHGAAVPPEVNIWTVQRDFDEFRKSGGGARHFLLRIVDRENFVL